RMSPQPTLGGPDYDAWAGGEDVPLDEQIVAVEREIRMRRGFYDKRLRMGLVTEEEARVRQHEMLAVRRTLVAVRDLRAVAELAREERR
ncbi:MAG: hypothetical protein K2X74_19010, partial [Acetobacteraceae bacterium]|nr:hypothetical protein [Acetobacteraceae bacterium]